MGWRAAGKPLAASRTKCLGGGGVPRRPRIPSPGDPPGAGFPAGPHDIRPGFGLVAEPSAVAYNVRHAPALLGPARGVGGGPDRHAGPVPCGLAGATIRVRLLPVSGAPHRRTVF